MAQGTFGNIGLGRSKVTKKRIRSDLNLNINLLPEEIHAFTETPLTVEVLDGKGNPVNGAEFAEHSPAKTGISIRTY